MFEWKQHRSGITPVAGIPSGQTAMWGLSVVRLRLGAPAVQGVLPRSLACGERVGAAWFRAGC